MPSAVVTEFFKKKKELRNICKDLKQPSLERDLEAFIYKVGKLNPRGIDISRQAVKMLIAGMELVINMLSGLAVEEDEQEKKERLLKQLQAINAALKQSMILHEVAGKASFALGSTIFVAYFFSLFIIVPWLAIASGSAIFGLAMSCVFVPPLVAGLLIALGCMIIPNAQLEGCATSLKKIERSSFFSRPEQEPAVPASDEPASDAIAADSLANGL